MKGIVFTEFMEMVEGKWGLDMVDDLIDVVNPDSGGAYTSVGTYDYQELVAYVVELNKRTEIPVSDLVYTFGTYLAASFASKFTDFFNECESTIEFLTHVDDHIHVEVRKLYPDAELPKFSYEQHSADALTLHYESTRNLADLAHGLIIGCAAHYGDKIDISRSGEVRDGVAYEEFKLTRIP